MTDDQATRHAEFLRLFNAMPGDSKADRIRFIRRRLGAAAPASITLRQWLMDAPPRYPSRQMLALIRGIASAA